MNEDTWLSAKSLFEQKARTGSPGPEPRWLLSGSLKCGVCGFMRFRVGPYGAKGPDGRPRPSYICSPAYHDRRAGSSGHVCRDAHRMNAIVEKAIIARLSEPDAAAALVRPGVDVAELSARRAVLRARLDEQAALYAAGKIDAQQMTVISASLLEQVRVAEEKLASAYRGSAMEGFASAADPGKLWDGLTIDRQRAVVKELIEYVLVKPVRGTQRRKDWQVGMPWNVISETIEIRWRAE